MEVLRPLRRATRKLQQEQRKLIHNKEHTQATGRKKAPNSLTKTVLHIRLNLNKTSMPKIPH